MIFPVSLFPEPEAFHILVGVTEGSVSEMYIGYLVNTLSRFSNSIDIDRSKEMYRYTTKNTACRILKKIYFFAYPSIIFDLFYAVKTMLSKLENL